MTEKATATKEMKYSFAQPSSPLDHVSLMAAIDENRHKFPHMGNNLKVLGQLGVTGIVLTNGQNEIVAAVRAPKLIAKSIDGNTVEYGAPQSVNNIEMSLERPVDTDFATRSAQLVIHALKNAKSLQEVAYNFTGLTAVGSEPEGWAIDGEGKPIDMDGGELQKGLFEESLEAASSPSDFLASRSEQIIRRKKTLSDGTIVVDTSVLPTGTPFDTKVADGGEIGPYVVAIQNILTNNFFTCADPTAKQLWDSISQNFGFKDFNDMKNNFGNMAFWVMSASHASVGLHHRRSGNTAMWVPIQEAIAVGDIFNSNLGTLAEFLTMSTPIIYGITPVVQVGDKSIWPRDYRSIAKYALDTANPSDFVLNQERLRERIIPAIVSGTSHTIDRASYIADVDEGQVPCMHGRVRNRMASSEPKNQTGRVEFTGSSATPSIYDELARNCFLQVLTIGAYEALANGQHPIDYFRDHFPNIARWQEQKKLAFAASLYGFNHPDVTALVNEGISFVDEMAKKYPALKNEATIAHNRLYNLLLRPVSSLNEYLHNPRGPFSEVLQNELSNGVNPIDLARKIDDYQVEMANRILASTK